MESANCCSFREKCGFAGAGWVLESVASLQISVALTANRSGNRVRCELRETGRERPRIGNRLRFIAYAVPAARSCPRCPLSRAFSNLSWYVADVILENALTGQRHFSLNTSSNRKRESRFRPNTLARASCLFLQPFRPNLALSS